MHANLALLYTSPDVMDWRNDNAFSMFWNRQFNNSCVCLSISQWLYLNCRGAMIKIECLVFVCRRGLLAYVYNGVSLTMNALVAGNGSYIVRPCGHDLHGPTSPFLCQFWASIGLCLNLPILPLIVQIPWKAYEKTWDLTVLWDRSTSSGHLNDLDLRTH